MANVESAVNKDSLYSGYLSTKAKLIFFVFFSFGIVNFFDYDNNDNVIQVRYFLFLIYLIIIITVHYYLKWAVIVTIIIRKAAQLYSLGFIIGYKQKQK